MNLEVFKAALESDATVRAAAQEKTIKELHVRIKALEKSNAKNEKDKRQLMNRCQALSGMMMCMFCGFRGECAPGEKNDV